MSSIGSQKRPVGEVEAPKVIESGGGRRAATEDVHGEGGIVVDRGVTESGQYNRDESPEASNTIRIIR